MKIDHEERMFLYAYSQNSKYCFTSEFDPHKFNFENQISGGFTPNLYKTVEIVPVSDTQIYLVAMSNDKKYVTSEMKLEFKWCLD